MNIELIWRCIMALPGLVVPGLSIGGPGLETRTAEQAPAQITAKATPTATPSATPKATAAPGAKATPKPATRTRRSTAPTPKASTAPRPTATPATGTSELASEQQCAGQNDVSKTASVLVCLTSFARVHNGLSSIGANSALMAAAVAKDQDMLSCGYSHTACGKEFNYWMTNKGYAGRCTAENIAQGQATPRAVFEAWMKSPGHRANILNGSYKDIGVAEVASSNGPMWVMELGGC